MTQTDPAKLLARVEELAEALAALIEWAAAADLSNFNDYAMTDSVYEEDEIIAAARRTLTGTEHFVETPKMIKSHTSHTAALTGTGDDVLAGLHTLMKHSTGLVKEGRTVVVDFQSGAVAESFIDALTRLATPAEGRK